MEKLKCLIIIGRTRFIQCLQQGSYSLKLQRVYVIKSLDSELLVCSTEHIWIGVPLCREVSEDELSTVRDHINKTYYVRMKTQGILPAAP